MDKNKLKSNFYQTLINYGYDITPSVISKMVEHSIKAKKEIIDVLRKHPAWNEDEMCIILSERKYSRVFKDTAIFDFATFLKNSAEYIHSDQDKKDRINKVFQELVRVKVPFFGDKEKKIVDSLNALNSEYRLHYTCKTSKVVMKICKEEGLDKIPNFDKKYSELSDLINPKEMIMKEVISVNPVDYLEMSNGFDYNWISCHNLKDGGWKAGTISYLLDNHSLIYYQVPDTTPINKIHNVSRYLRQVWLYTDECLAALRLYPQDNDGDISKGLYAKIRTTVLDIFAECLDVKDDESPWLTSFKMAHKIIEKGDYDAVAYPDWELGNPGAPKCCVSKLRTRTKMMPTFYGGEIPRCVKCGAEHYNEASLYCDECGG